MTNEESVRENLAIVDAHFASESGSDLDKVLPLYTDDIVWESPARGIVLHGRQAAAENYRRTFGSMADLSVTSLRRFATADRVVDDSIASFQLVGDEMVNAPLPPGAHVDLRLVHVFDMRDRRIAREAVYEIWPVAALDSGLAASTPTVAEEASPEQIMQLGFGFWGSKTLLSAVEIGVFTELGKGPLDGETLARRLGLHRRSYRDFFDTLVALGVLERSKGVYSNTAQTALLLDRSKPSYIGGILEMANARLYPFWGALTEALRTGERQNDTKGSTDFFQTLYDDPQRLREFLQAMTGVSMGAARAIAQQFPWRRYQSFVDVGTAQGGAAVRIALAQPHLRGAGYDLPTVGPIFQEYVRSFGLLDRLHFIAGDFFKDDIPQTDVIVMGHILHDWNLEEKKRLVAKAYASLPRGGAFIVYEALIDDERRRNAFGLLMSLNMLIETPGGFDYTGADCSRWMREAGFRETWVEHLVGPDSMVVGIK
jgi:ketosteroid isomerase-like protein